MGEWQPIETYHGFQVVIFADAEGHVWPGHRSNSRSGAPDEFTFLHSGGCAAPTHWRPLPAPPTREPDLLALVPITGC